MNLDSKDEKSFEFAPDGENIYGEGFDIAIGLSSGIELAPEHGSWAFTYREKNKLTKTDIKKDIETFKCSKSTNWNSSSNTSFMGEEFDTTHLTCSSAFKNNLAGKYGANVFKYLKFYLKACTDNKSHP